MADTGFENGGGALTQNCQINGFVPEFYINKSKICVCFFWGGGGGARPRAPSKSATVAG